MEDLKNILPTGKENAISARELAAKLGVSDRVLSVVSQNICQKRFKKTRSKKTHRDMTENRGNTGDMAVL